MNNTLQSGPKLIGFFDLFVSTLSFYKKHYKEIAVVSLVPLAINFLEIVIRSVTSLFPESSQIMSTSEIFTTVIIVIVMVIIGVAGVVASILATISLYKRIIIADNGQSQPSIKSTYNDSLKLFWPMIWLGILSSLTVIGGYILLIIPGIILSIYTGYGVVSLISDGHRGLNALAHSFYLVRRTFWKVLWRNIQFALVCFAAYVIVGLIVVGLYSVCGGDLSLGGIIATLNVAKAYPTITIIFGFFPSLIYWLVIIPILTIFSYLFFKSLKSLKPEPDPAIEFKKSRGWFMGLSIFGIVAGVLVFIVMMLTIVLVSLNVAREKAIATQEMTTPTVVTQNLFPSKTEVFPQGDKSELGYERSEYKNYTFSILGIMGWLEEEGDDGVFIHPLDKSPDASVTIDYRKINIEHAGKPTEMKASIIAGDTYGQFNKIKDVQYHKYELDGLPAYSMSGIITDEKVGKDYFLETISIFDGNLFHHIKSIIAMNDLSNVRPAYQAMLRSFRVIREVVPQVTSVYPTTGEIGDRLTVRGINFGSKPVLIIKNNLGSSAIIPQDELFNTSEIRTKLPAKACLADMNSGQCASGFMNIYVGSYSIGVRSDDGKISNFTDIYIKSEL
ncbi:MAG: hypothetical protein NT077_00100 [Candidatus Taylorbacteria bacterium]|nr:hypothetical protein [Candidatus Taylorbacteria bacterium]